jgi:hypothetical protein
MKKRYVYYDVNTGHIKEILSVRKPGRARYIECSNDEVRGFITGEIGINDWIVAYNKKLDKHILIEKNNVIKLRKPSKTLYKIPYKKTIDSDLTLIYYSDNVLEVSLDVSRIAPLYQTNFRDEVVFERGTEIRITLKEKDSGNLLKEFVIDAQELLKAGQLFFDLYDHIYSNNVEFFTYKMFENYSWFKGSIKLMSPIKNKIKFDIHKADSKQESENSSYHLIMTPTKTGLKIKNNIEDLKLIRFHDQIEFFVVDKHDPNILYEKFSLTEEILKDKVILIKLDTDMRGKSILYNQKYISVLKED